MVFILLSSATPLYNAAGTYIIETIFQRAIQAQNDGKLYIGALENTASETPAPCAFPSHCLYLFPKNSR
jgi:hypothetical protein